MLVRHLLSWPAAKRCGHLVALLGLALLSGCAGYASKIREPRQAFERGEYPRAIDELTKLAEKHDNDELLYLMDLGIVAHTAGNYAVSIDAFSKADHIAEVKDYTSITKEAAALLTSDDAKPYVGEDFEKILINVYLAMDYTLLHRWEDALVESRRVNHKLDLYIAQAKQPYEHNAFAKYLSAVLFEAQKEYDDALVDYRQFDKWMAGFPYAGAPLLRIFDRRGDSQELAEYKKKFPDVGNYKIAKNQGEIVLLLESGRAPIKVPNPAFHLMPKFVKVGYGSNFAWLNVDGVSSPVRTYPLFDIEQTAIKELDGKSAGIIAKKIAGYAAKEAAAYAMSKATKSELAGALTSIFLHVSDHADLRSWTTLPARLQLARIVVPAGRHVVTLDNVSMYGADNKSARRWDNVEVKPGETVFLNYRAMN